MKVKIEITDLEGDEVKAVLNCINNQLIIDNVWDEIFRPVIKYSDDEKKVETYQEVWDRWREYAGER